MTKGLDEILSNITKLQVNNQKAAKAAVTQVADEFAKELKNETPYGGFSDDNLKDDVAVSGFKGKSQGIISKEIGYGKNQGWRAHFPDDGTLFQPSQDFKERTINKMTPRAKEIYAEKIKEGLNL